jgi:hypothetical protein
MSEVALQLFESPNYDLIDQHPKNFGVSILGVCWRPKRNVKDVSSPR